MNWALGHRVGVILLLMIVTGCISVPARDLRGAVNESALSEASEGRIGTDGVQRTTIERLRSPSRRPGTIDVAADLTPGQIEARVTDIETLVSDQTIEVALPPQPLPEFVDTVFGVLLDVPYSLGPGVAARTDMVSLRGAQEVSKRVFFSQVQTALKDYGLVVIADDGAIRILQSDTLTQGAPVFIRSRTSGMTPQANRPVLQFFELRSIGVNSILELLKQAFPDNEKVSFAPRQQDNTLVISGNASDVAAAARVVAQIDQPRLAGGQVARIEPVFWKAEELGQALIRVLSTEGYQVIQANGAITRSVNVVSLPSVNQLLIFATNPEGYQRALYWVNELDQPSGVPDDATIFTYLVKNTDAAEVGLVLARAYASADATGQAQLGLGQQPQAANNRRNNGGNNNAQNSFESAVLDSGSRITVDRGRNRILFQGSAAEYSRIRDLLIELDEPPAQALIEVTIAEVTLTDSTALGVEFAETNDNNQVTASTLGGLNLGTSGLRLSFIEDDVRIALNALATSSNVNVLSTPRIVARSGQQARIQVGTDIPVVSSQRATQFDQGADPGTDVLQSISYRQTGVILAVEPIIYGDNRIDLNIQQEVSSTSSDAIPGISSPIISNRTIETQIALREGATAVLGGLIQDNYDRSQRGIPVLKDLPYIGNFFRSLSVNGTKSELLIFVTPYIMRTDEQIAEATSTYIDSINATLEYARGSSYTLNPFPNDLGRDVSSVHGASLSSASTSQ